MKKIDWLGLIAILTMLVGASMVVYYLIVFDINQCTSDPIRYAIGKIDIPYNYSAIELSFYLEEEDTIPVFNVKFDVDGNYIYKTPQLDVTIYKKNLSKF